jgi:hypothetical protein
VNQTALECGNSPAIIFKHYLQLVRDTETKKWFGIVPDATKKMIEIPKPDEKLPAVA